jgi:pimeloyl-ACP methyl ester carboxylesterase
LGRWHEGIPKNRRSCPSDVSDEGWFFVASSLALVREYALQRRHDLLAGGLRRPEVDRESGRVQSTRSTMRVPSGMGTRNSTKAWSRARERIRLSTFVLIHGGWHGAWCWDKVVPLLEQASHEVVRFDLPGHGEDRTPAAEVTLQSYTDRVVEALDAQPEPVVLVGHSLGGVAISQAAEQRPEKIEKLVYVCALLLPDGKSAGEASQGDGGSVVFNYVEMQPDQGRALISEEGLKEALYHDCPQEDFERALRLVTPQPIAPLGTPIEVTEGNFGSVRRTYVHTTRDRTASPAAQEQMYTEMPCEKVVSMATGHLPFFAAPKELAGHLDSLARL